MAPTAATQPRKSNQMTSPRVVGSGMPAAPQRKTNFRGNRHDYHQHTDDPESILSIEPAYVHRNSPFRLNAAGRRLIARCPRSCGHHRLSAGNY
jgi:hypothetical protein